MTQPQPPYLAPYRTPPTPAQISARYEIRRGVQCPCGHSYASHRILGGECTIQAQGVSPDADRVFVWRPCRCMQFRGELDD